MTKVVTEQNALEPNHTITKAKSKIQQTAGSDPCWPNTSNAVLS